MVDLSPAIIPAFSSGTKDWAQLVRFILKCLLQCKPCAIVGPKRNYLEQSIVFSKRMHFDEDALARKLPRFSNRGIASVTKEKGHDF